MSDADRLRAQIPTSTDPAWLEREAKRTEREDNPMTHPEVTVSDAELAELLEIADSAGNRRLASVYSELQSRRAAQPDRAAIVEECAKVADRYERSVSAFSHEVQRAAEQAARMIASRIRALSPIQAGD